MIPISFLLLYNSDIWEEVYENIFNIRCWWQCHQVCVNARRFNYFRKIKCTNSYGYPKIYDQFQDQINGMALSMPGIIDPERGYQYTGGALRYIDKLETVEVLKKRCPTNITIGNDAKCAANAEIGFGNLQDIQDGAVVILGTGIGGCLIKDHKVHTGKRS